VTTKRLTLDEHLSKVAIYNQTKDVYKNYTQLAPKHRQAFKDKHNATLQQHEAAHKYLTEHLNVRTTIPEKAWKAEREKLLRERFILAEPYYDLKDDVKNMEVIRRGAVRVINEITPECSRARLPEMEL